MRERKGKRPPSRKPDGPDAFRNLANHLVGGHGGKRRGAGRPSEIEDPVLIHAKVSRRQLRGLDARAERRGLSRSAALREILEALAGREE